MKTIALLLAGSLMTLSTQAGATPMLDTPSPVFFTATTNTQTTAGTKGGSITGRVNLSATQNDKGFNKVDSIIVTADFDAKQGGLDRWVKQIWTDMTFQAAGDRTLYYDQAGRVFTGVNASGETTNAAVTDQTGTYTFTLLNFDSALEGLGLSFTTKPSLFARFRSADISLAAAAVPEPASWALMLAGFGLIGATLRQRRSVRVRFA